MMIVRFIVCLTLLLPAVIFAKTEKSGIISRSERWEAEKGPYIITDDLVITSQARVVIAPGCEILVGKPIKYIEGITQYDHLDSFSVSIKVEGSLKCIGRREKMITFRPEDPESQIGNWYGIIINGRAQSDVEIAFTTVSGAFNGIVTNGASPIIRNAILEYNNTGIYCVNQSMPKIINSVIANNRTCGIKNENSAPYIYNNIVAFNPEVGIWSDERTSFKCMNNCFFSNGEHNFYKTDPRLGVLIKKNKNGDSTDFSGNIMLDPIFAGSPSDSVATEMDISTNTDLSIIKDTALAKIITPELTDSVAIKVRLKNYKRYELSKYSPCINAGAKNKIFNDEDNSRNDIGLFGGKEFVDFTEFRF